MKVKGYRCDICGKFGNKHDFLNILGITYTPSWGEDLAGTNIKHVCKECCTHVKEWVDCMLEKENEGNE